VYTTYVLRGALRFYREEGRRENLLRIKKKVRENFCTKECLD
jgi:hypothetical protein